MPLESQPATTPKAMYWIGWVLSVLPVPLFVMGAVMGILQPPEVQKNSEAMGWPTDMGLVIAILDLTSLAFYLIPQTAVLGAILLTGYLGGAVATHLRVGDNVSCIMPVAFGVVIWLGLYLRDARLRALIPLRKL